MNLYINLSIKSGSEKRRKKGKKNKNLRNQEFIIHLFNTLLLVNLYLWNYILKDEKEVWRQLLLTLAFQFLRNKILNINVFYAPYLSKNFNAFIFES